MAESAVGFLIKQLSTLLSQESTLLGGLQPDVQFIKDELGSMKAFLRQAEAKEDNDSQLQEWVKQVREVAYDTEDVLNDFAFRFARGHADGFCGGVGKIYNSIKNLKARHRISLEIKDIKARVVEISARRQRYQPLHSTQERDSSSSNVANADYDIRDQALLIEEAKLVGIDQPKKELVSKILDDHSHLQLVSVVGMGGLGKTTLVKKAQRICQGLPQRKKDKDKIDEWEMILHGFGGEVDGSALGFIEEKEGMTATDIAMRYLKELINRSLIQVKDTWADGKLKECGLHDFLREIIVSKSKEQSFTAIITRYCTRWPDKVRHLAIHNFTDNPPQGFSSLKCLRSVETFGYEDPLTTSFLSKFLCGGPKFLKVLNLASAELDSIPKEVFKLFHLEYLDLSGTRVKVIPKSIGQLQNLEFLILAETTIMELPVEILKLRKLRTLTVGREGDYSNNFALWGFKSPDGIGKLTSLESLSCIEVDNGKIVREIGKLVQLRQLSITKLRREDGKELVSSLSRLTNLRELYICSIKEEETLDLQHSVSPRLALLTTLSLSGRLERVPEWLISLQSLRMLALHNSELSEDENAIDCLGHLPNLADLTLYRAYEGETLCFKAGGFRKLRQLGLVQLKRLKWVRVEEESMSSLQEFVIIGCKLMESLPLGLQNLTKLKGLGLADMSDELIHKTQNLDKQSEDYQTISHIPQVGIGHWINGEWKTEFL
ncbi:unnamed protein product [Coffea canephora]|uniref:DH200=94 genomic scaffold, scaffold_4164 n=1 Tax=Coffea canephora TaxID=49390 RepID=A0A068VKU0_COFCA|nr:unnamed protein product [Coffea canephora]